MTLQGTRQQPPDGFSGINGARVEVVGTRLYTLTENDSQGNPGYFFLGNIGAGTRTIRVSADGYDPVEYQVTVLPGQTVDGGSAGDETLLGAKKWTILVYMNADNDLEQYGILNMNQMETVGSDANVNIVVQFDRSAKYDGSNGDWQGTRRYYVTKDSDANIIHSDLLQDMGEQDMGNPDVLRDFITWGITNYPAERYCLIMWNHGAGWRSRDMDPGRGISYDDGQGTFLTMAQWRQAMAQAQSATGVTFNLLAVDASLMGMVEVAYELRGLCGLLTFSEESPPGKGYPYDDFLTQLAATPQMSTLEFAQAITDAYIEDNPNYGVTQSVVDPNRIVPVASAIQDLAVLLKGNFGPHLDHFVLARDNAQSYVYEDYKDAVDFLSRFRDSDPDSGVKQRCNDVIQAIGSAVLYERHAGLGLTGSNGLSLWVPTASKYVTGQNAYSQLLFTQDYPAWTQLLGMQ